VGTAKTRVGKKTQDLFRHPVVTPPTSSEEVSDSKASQAKRPTDLVVTAVVTAVVTPVSGAHSTPSQPTGPADQGELIRNLVALVKEDPGVGPCTLAPKLDPHHRQALGSDEVTA